MTRNWKLNGKHYTDLKYGEGTTLTPNLSSDWDSFIDLFISPVKGSTLYVRRNGVSYIVEYIDNYRLFIGRDSY